MSRHCNIVKLVPLTGIDPLTPVPCAIGAAAMDSECESASGPESDYESESERQSLRQNLGLTVNLSRELPMILRLSPRLSLMW